MPYNRDFTKVTACGESCVGCAKRESGACRGCIESDGHCEEWAQSEVCPIHSCARQHEVQFCGLCPSFPCERLAKTITWNPQALPNLAALAREYKETHGG